MEPSAHHHCRNGVYRTLIPRHALLPLMFIIISTHCLAQPSSNSADPLTGTLKRFPGPVATFSDTNLTRLLDVGACLNGSDPYVSYVPPLDGTNPLDTLCQDSYAMKFVLFDLQLVELKNVDSVGGSFQAEILMIFHWLDDLDQGSTEIDSNCSFLCDSESRSQRCCDHVWVPPLRLPGCDVNGIQAYTPEPSFHTVYGSKPLTFEECTNGSYPDRCYWRRLWYLDVDATCTSHMDFHNFPFDVQTLTIDILNPYASRTWFQLTKGFLKQNVGEGSNGISLSPDSQIPGWYIKNVTISGTCGTTQAWQETFLTQDSLLVELQGSQTTYTSQNQSIKDAFSDGKLQCAAIEDIINNNEALGSALDMDLYWSVSLQYSQRLNSTLEEYKLCMAQHAGNDFAWNKTIFQTGFARIAKNSASRISTSKDNIERSFNILGLSSLANQTTQIWFPCVVQAVAKLATPGMRVTILIQRYQKFYVMKLILPTIACVAFAFTAFGIQPQDLLGRLSVLVPSAIALTAVQGFVVGSDIPPVAYIAPSAHIILTSYLAQLLIAYECVMVKCCCSRNRVSRFQRVRTASLSRRDAPGMIANSKRSFNRLPDAEQPGATPPQMGALAAAPSQGEDIEPCLDKEETSMLETSRASVPPQMGAPAAAVASLEISNGKTCNPRWSAMRIFDLAFAGCILIAYVVAIAFSVLLPYHRSELRKKDFDNYRAVSIWPTS